MNKLISTHRVAGFLIASCFSIICSFSYGQLVVSGTETIVNSTTAYDQINPSVAMDTAGNYIMVWSSFLEDGDDYGIYGQGYTAGGAVDGIQFKISPTNTSGQIYPDVAMNAAGGFVTVWQSFNEDSDPGTQGIYARRYTGPGVPSATDFRINSTSTGDQSHPKIAITQAGDFTIVWMD
ncbi:MAG: hypothetical protein JKY54_12875, partial [Flavobacteriales bacterium]|nr:hypothetical protein [Flavobacteriales bacterium]